MNQEGFEQEQDMGDQRVFDINADKAVQLLLAELYSEARDVRGKGGIIPREIRKDVFVNAKDAFEELCEMARNHPSQWKSFVENNSGTYAQYRQVLSIITETVVAAR